jgi:hypothetical protein
MQKYKCQTSPKYNRKKRRKAFEGNYITRLVSLVEQELPTIPEHPSSSPVYCGVRVAQSSLYFVDYCFSFFFGYGCEREYKFNL